MAVDLSSVDPGSERGALLRRYNAGLTERNYFTQHWMDLNDYIQPRSSRFFVTQKNRVALRNTKINDGTATLALRALSAGMMSGVTNPARPWFQLRAVDSSLNEKHSVQVYLDKVRERIAEVFLKSNLYTTLPSVYSDLGCYGTSAFEIVEDPITGIRCYSWPIGSYTLGLSDRLAVDSTFREANMTAHQIASRFGIENCSQKIQSAIRNRNLDYNYTVMHALVPNPEHDPSRLESLNKKYRSYWWETSSQQDEWLRVSGFDSFPAISPRWQVLGEDTYGISPGMEALGDVMALQLEQKRKIQIIEKYVNPPLQAPTGLRNAGAVTNLPGGITWVDVMSGQQGIAPAYQTNLQGLQFLTADIQEIHQRIDSIFYKDLFLMIANDERSGVTATEIAARQEEKLLALGPVYLRINDELLDAILERTIDILTQKSIPYWTGMINGDPPLPAPPPELAGAQLNFEYISTMAQAMKAVGVASIERTMTFAGSLGQAFPGILDNFDSDKVLRTYVLMNGTPPDLLLDEEKVLAIRQQHIADQKAQQALQAANSGADTAQKLANSPLSDNNALTQLMGRVSQPSSVGAQ